LTVHEPEFIPLGLNTRDVPFSRALFRRFGSFVREYMFVCVEATDVGWIVHQAVRWDERLGLMKRLDYLR
jgi:hypothetical protein